MLPHSDSFQTKKLYTRLFREARILPCTSLNPQSDGDFDTLLVYIALQVPSCYSPVTHFSLRPSIGRDCGATGDGLSCRTERYSQLENNHELPA